MSPSLTGNILVIVIFQFYVIKWFWSIWKEPWTNGTITHCRCCWSHFSRVRLCETQPHRQQPIRLSRPWDSPGKNTGVGCHFLLQCMKVKSESEVAQLYPTLSDPMDYSLPGSSVHGIFQARVLEWRAIAFSDTVLWEAGNCAFTEIGSRST